MDRAAATSICRIYLTGALRLMGYALALQAHRLRAMMCNETDRSADRQAHAETTGGTRVTDSLLRGGSMQPGARVVRLPAALACLMRDLLGATGPARRR